MELLGIIAFFVALAFLGQILSAAGRAAKAAGKTAIGKGSLAENFELEFKGMGEFELRFEDAHLGEDGSGPLVKEIHCRGLFPLGYEANVGVVVSVFDATSGEYEPVISLIDAFQESDSLVFQNSSEIGRISGNQGFPRWTRIGAVIPDMLQPPCCGERELKVVVRLVDLECMPSIVHGFHQKEDSGLLYQKVLTFSYRYVEKGYQEESQHRDESVGLALKIAMAVAMADGNLDEAEGETLQRWIRKSISAFSEGKQEHLKQVYNEAMRESYSLSKSGDLSLSELTSRLSEIGEKAAKYEAIELCFEVMAADGVADNNELQIIKNVAAALELDLDEVENMRDQRIVGLDAGVSSDQGIETLLGIEPHWDESQIKKHLRSEFQKWNNRLNALPEGAERDNAQRMLDAIAETRRKHA